MSRRPVPTVHPGLVNPQVQARPSTGAPTAKPSINPAPTSFRTRIPEPRWQQVISVLLALTAIGLWLLLVTHAK